MIRSFLKVPFFLFKNTQNTSKFSYLLRQTTSHKTSAAGFCTTPPSKNESGGEIKLNKFKDNPKQIEQEDIQNEEKEEMTLAYKLALLSIGASAIYILYKLNQIQSQLKKIDDVRVSHRGQAAIGEDWELIDTEGNIISQKSFYGSYYLVYFGFCHCPDICPANLIKIRNALARIKNTEQGKNLDIKVLFISVDPERDTPSIIREFLDMYDKTFIGGTGQNEQKMKETLQGFKVVANKILYEPDDEELKELQKKYKGDTSKFYTMDHTTNTFLMDPKGKFVNFYDGNRAEEDLATNILSTILQREKQTAQNSM